MMTVITISSCDQHHDRNDRNDRNYHLFTDEHDLDLVKKGEFGYNVDYDCKHDASRDRSHNQRYI